MAVNPTEFYQKRLAEAQAELATIQKRLKLLVRIRLVVGVMILAAVWFLLKEQLPGSGFTLAGICAIFLVFVRRHGQEEIRETQVLRRIGTLENELAALQGDISSFRSGREYTDSKHPYTYDLDFFGERSVYQLLCRTATEEGASALAKLLQYPYAGQEEILGRQSVVKEVAEKPDMCVGFRVAGAGWEEKRGDLQKILDWLEMPDFFVTRWFFRVIAVVMPVVVVGLIVLAALGYSMLPFFTLVVVINWTILGFNAKAIKETANYVARSAKLIGKYEALLAELGQEQFETVSWDKDAQAASLAIARLKKLAHLFESRYNQMVGPLMNSFVLFDLQCCLRLEQWRRTHKAAMAEGLKSVTEADYFISLGTYAFNHPEQVYPEVRVGENVYQAEGMAHPLLQKGAVGNKFELGRREYFYLLTGANMTGKSTFIRTVGVNLVLGYCGLPVRAGAATLPLVKLYTAMRITDSVQDDISYFRAELNRISEIMREASASEQPYLILLDEPLRGTNTTDKQNGTRSIMEKLIRLNAIGIVATHDTVLCSLEEEYRGQVSNYHFESSLEGNELLFDYQLKHGCSTSNNATILMKQLGIV